MRSLCAVAGGRLLPFIVLCFVFRPVEVIAQTAAADENRPAAVTAADSSRGGGEFLPVWHAAISNIPGDWLRFGRLAFAPRYGQLMAGTAVLTVALVAADDPVWQRSHIWYTTSPGMKRLSDDLEWVGDGRPQFGLAGVFAAWGFLAGDARALRTGSQIVETILASGTLVQVLKHVTGRESPFVSTRPAGRWDLFPNQIQYAKHVPHYDAYPSGHVTTALATVTVVIENYPEWWWARPLGYAAIAGLAFSMGNTGIHWYSDYPLAVVLGYSFGMIAAHPLETGGLAGETAPGEPKLSVAPMIDPVRTGVVVSLSF